MIEYTEQEFLEMLEQETMRAATVGLEYGLNIAASAFSDALERAEFVGAPLLVERVKETVSRTFADSQFSVSFNKRSGQEDEDGNS
jgi:hypothetical protein